MQYTNIKKLFDLSSEASKIPQKFLQNNGFSEATAYNVVSARFTNLRLDKIEKLCIVMNFTTKDILE